MEQIYNDGTYLEHNPSWHEEGSSWKASKIIKIIEDNKLLPNTVCEVGCGAGEILNTLADEYPKVGFVGYEISSQAYDICKSKKKENLTFKLSDLLEQQQSFDIVMAIDVFEHIEDYFTFLRKLKGKGDYKIFHIPIELSVF